MKHILLLGANPMLEILRRLPLGRRQVPAYSTRMTGLHGQDRAYSAHSMRTIFIAAALENGAQLEDVLTTEITDRRLSAAKQALSIRAP